MTAVDETGAVQRSPARLSGRLSVGVAGVVVLVVLPFSVPGAVLAAGGVVATGVAAVTGSRGVADLAGVGLLAGVVVAGQAAPPPVVLAGVVATVLAWDLVGNAIGLGRQLGREADTARAELVHAGASLAVGTVTALAGYVVYRVGVGRGVPVAAVVLLVVAGVVLVSALRP